MRRYGCSVWHWRPSRPSLRRLAALLRTQAREARFSAHLLDRPAAHETVNVDTCKGPLRGHADDCVCQLGGIRMLVGMGTTVLSNVPETKPDPNHATHDAAARHGHIGGLLHRARNWSRRRHVHRRYRHAHDRLRGPPVRRDRPESIVLGVLLPLGVSRRTWSGLYVRGWHALRLQGVVPA